MGLEQWAAVDRYITDLIAPEDPILQEVIQTSAVRGLASINVTANQGKLLHLLAKALGARRILEIGALGGYSTIWLARALPAGGQLITLEVDPTCAEVALANIERAGLADFVELRLAPALETLPKLAAEGLGPFDLVFIDADKPSTPDYLDWAIRLSREGSLIIVDNVVREGAVVDSESDDARVQGMRRFFERLAVNPHVSATAIQTVGGKGYDGFAIALVVKAPHEA
jgi:predicted O-methyltransferase YrrM